MAKYKIGVIGAGNVGTHLCRAFSKAGHKVVVFTRHGASHLLADVKELVWTEHLKSFKRGFDFIIIAINDDGIKEIAEKFNPEDGIVLHTSGSTAMSILGSGKIKHYGVFYPLQSFHKKLNIKYEDIPVFVEGSSKENLKSIRKLARSFSNIVVDMESEQRKRMHLAAVMLNNFSNHLATLSQEFLNETKISFKNLLPLFLTTANRLIDHNPSELQTGPAKRNDVKVMKEHLKMLEDHPEMKEIYELMSASIQKHYKVT